MEKEFYTQAEVETSEVDAIEEYLAGTVAGFLLTNDRMLDDFVRLVQRTMTDAAARLAPQARSTLSLPQKGA